MRDPQLNTRVDEEVREAVEEYADREQTNKSTAVRQFLLRGMSQAGEAPDSVDVPESAASAVADGGLTWPMRLRRSLLTWAGRFVVVALALVPLPLLGAPGFLEGVALVLAAEAFVAAVLGVGLYYYEENTLDRGALDPQPTVEAD